MIPSLSMKKNGKSNNLSLIYGYFLLLFLMGVFGSMLYSSTNNIKKLDIQLRSMTLDFIKRDESGIDFLIKQYDDFLNQKIIQNIIFTYPENSFTALDGINNKQDFLNSVDRISVIIDSYSTELSRSQTILFFSHFLFFLLLFQYF